MTQPTSRPAGSGQIVLAGVRKSYDGLTDAVEHLDLAIEPGEFLTFLGPSGSGKTTTLMMLAGFERPSAGDILLDGRSIRDVPPHERGFGMVFQNYALFPHLSVAENIAFPLVVRKLPAAEISARVARSLEMIKLAGLGSRFPGQLSGGQQQRVALGRALVFEPRLVLMDEPLGALDRRLREEMQVEIRHLHRSLGVTVVYVTHDQVEAMAMSDRVAVFNHGRIRQLGPPRLIHESPADGFVARFVGDTNALPGTVEAVDEGRIRFRLDDGTVVIGTSPDRVELFERRLASIRPARIRLDAGAELDNSVVVAVEDTTYLGDRLAAVVRLTSGLTLTVDLGVDGVDRRPANGEPVRIGWAANHCHVLKPD